MKSNIVIWPKRKCIDLELQNALASWSFPENEMLSTCGLCWHTLQSKWYRQNIYLNRLLLLLPQLFMWSTAWENADPDLDRQLNTTQPIRQLVCPISSKDRRIMWWGWSLSVSGFQGKTLLESYFNGLPKDWWFKISPSGWISDEIDIVGSKSSIPPTSSRTKGGIGYWHSTVMEAI